jgi:dephospho-CoA kinase
LRLQLADDILSNTGSLEALHADIRRLHRQYCDSAQRANANGLT